MPATPSWDACPSSHAAEPGRPGSDLPCCVHVVGDAQARPVRFVSFFCCWCGKAVVHPALPVPPLPRRGAAALRHGPVARGCRPARRSDVGERSGR